MKKKTLLLKILLAFAVTTFAVSAAYADGAANFKADVNAAIDAGLAYSRANNYFTTVNNGNGFSLLTLLEKQSIPAGYNGLNATDKGLAESAACILISSGAYGARGSFYSYYDGQVLMGLSVYLDTGGPDHPTGCGVGTSAAATIDKVVDRSVAAQTQSGVCSGYWGYTGTGCDSSTTQLTIAGLAAAKNFYTINVPLSPRIASITTALNRTSDGYAGTVHPQSGGIFDTCGSGCYGHGYQQNYGVGSLSTQQTASGTWGQLVGTRNINSPSVQGYLRWLQNAYNPDNNNNWGGYFGANSYFYFLWSSSKAYNIMKDSGITPAVGNIGPDDMGTLPAVSSGGFSRIVNRNPAIDPQPAPRGSNGAGYYGNAAAGWYYDYSYRLMSLQNAPGQFPNPLGSWGYPEVDHAYAILVLQRSLGGIVVVPQKCDANGDQMIDMSDINLIMAVLGKIAAPGDVRDLDGNGLITVNDARGCVLKCTKAKCAK